jgi:hypothetical protein
MSVTGTVLPYSKSPYTNADAASVIFFKYDNGQGMHLISMMA